MTKKQSTIRTSREREHVHMMFYANVGSIVGLTPMTLYFIRIFVDYDLSLISDFIYMYLGVICLLLSYFTRYLINQLEHITDLYYSSDMWNKTDNVAAQVTLRENPEINNQNQNICHQLKSSALPAIKAV